MCLKNTDYQFQASLNYNMLSFLPDSRGLAMPYNLQKQLEPLFYPRSVAFFGVSTRNESAGNQFLRVFQTYGYKGKIYPVHHTAVEICGLRAYPSVKDIPGDVDMAVISAPAQHVPQIIADCVAKGIPTAEIFSAGFREVHEIGRKLEQDILDQAQGKIRIVGPNCFGVYSPGGGLTLLPGANYPKQSGNIGILAQSGGWVTDLIWGSDGFNVFFSKAVSYGNGIDLNEISLMEYFTGDPETAIIGAYLEGISDGKRFMELVRNLRGKKPVVIWKGGLSETGKRAVSSHTGSLAGNKHVWNAFFRQSGAVQARSFEELLDTIAAFDYIPEGEYRNLAIIGGGGGVGVSASDICEEYNMNIPHSSHAVIEAISNFLPAQGTGNKNPFDIGAPSAPASILHNVLEIAHNWDAIDALIINRMFFYGMKELMGEDMPEQSKRAGAIIEFKKAEAKKPIIVVLEELAAGQERIGMEMSRRQVRDDLLKAGIYVVPSMYRAIRALANVSSYWQGAHAERR
jgi:acyl-CoA synthetase (NDP forming)